MLVIAALALIISLQHLNEPPAYIHAWAQADNYSLALGFQHNGGDFFHPQTLIYNKQQKGYEDPVSLVTACDLPLHHWLVSGLMTVTGSRQPWVFRGFTLAISILGLWALYLLAFSMTHSRSKALLAASITATAPTFAYYSSSFLPSSPALALAMGGLLLYVLHVRDNKTWTLYVGLLLLTLAMMERTSMAVLWVATTCFQVLRIWQHEATLRRSWPPFVTGAALFAAWWFWSMHLRNEYGSLFLGSLLPVHNLDEAKEIMRNIHFRWRLHYFQHLHYALFLATLVGVIVSLATQRKKERHDRGHLSLWWFLAIWMFGEVLFVIAMSRQFMHHDYYFLDSLFLPLVFLFILMLGTIPNPTSRQAQATILVILLVLTGFMAAEALKMQQIRRTEGTGEFQTAMRYKGANQMLEQNGLGSKELRFLTLFSYPQNLPFVMMDREGYAVMWADPEVVAHALTFDYDYILVEDEVFRREFETSPLQVLPRLKRLAGNGEISVCTLSDSVLHPTADHFFKTE